MASLLVVFNIGQRTAVAGAFKLAGYEGDLMTLRVDDPTERLFVLTPPDLAALRDVRVLEQIVGQVLGCKVAVVERRADLEPIVPFE
jgi:hypothetical protein